MRAVYRIFIMLMLFGEREGGGGGGGGEDTHRMARRIGTAKCADKSRLDSMIVNRTKPRDIRPPDMTSPGLPELARVTAKLSGRPTKKKQLMREAGRAPRSSEARRGGREGGSSLARTLSGICRGVSLRNASYRFTPRSPTTNRSYSGALIKRRVAADPLAARNFSTLRIELGRSRVALHSISARPPPPHPFPSSLPLLSLYLSLAARCCFPSSKVIRKAIDFGGGKRHAPVATNGDGCR